jgi:Spy/CpxP family protein refolding chaperone
MNSKVQAALLMLFVFGLGLGTGMLWQSERGGHEGYRSPWKERRIARLIHELQLTPDQEKSARDIFENARTRAQQVNEEVAWDLEDIHRDSVSALRSVLTPVQIARFDQMHQRMHRRHHTPMEEPASGISVSTTPAVSPKGD